MAHDQRSRSGSSVMARCRPDVVAALFAAAMTAACSSTQPTVMSGEPNVAPVNYKTEILAYMRNYLNDPTGVREAYITEPSLIMVGGTQRYVSCLRFNAKNSVGKYEGSKDRVVAFLAGRFDTLAPARDEQCKDANWQPFPELEKLRR
jgi:hypothetical protein